jgi:hypothetical protein
MQDTKQYTLAGNITTMQIGRPSSRARERTTVQISVVAVSVKKKKTKKSSKLRPAYKEKYITHYTGILN